MTPGLKKIGINTDTKDTVMDTIVKAISLPPLSEACMGVMPSSTWRTMFSSITIASSTTSPTAKVIPKSETLSKL